MILKKILILLIIIIFSACNVNAGESLSLDTETSVSDMYAINNFLVYQPYKPKKNEKIFDGFISFNSFNACVCSFL